MNTDTNDLYDLEKLGKGEIYKLIRDEHFYPLPKKLHFAAKVALKHLPKVHISRTSGGKISRWAAGMRKNR